MKRTNLLLVLFFSLAVPFSPLLHADDPGKGNCKDKEPGCIPLPPKPICLNVFCSFHGEGAASTAEKCQAGAVFKKLVSGDGSEIADDSSETFNPRFEVQCDHQSIFNGSAHRYTDALGTRLQAEIGPFPAVVLPRGALREGHRYEQSELELGGQANYRGFCFIYTGPQLM